MPELSDKAPENNNQNQQTNLMAEAGLHADSPQEHLPESNHPMEVHHHAHHEHHKKTWKVYFFDFFMLFLAVFCGFLAEYQLEHKIERDREVQYVESMIEDLKEDTTKIGKTITVCYRQLAGLDSLLQNVYNESRTDSSIRMLYYLNRRYTSSGSSVAFTKRTITQLKNSGGLRLIRNKAASDSITLYGEMSERLENQATAVSNYRLNVSSSYGVRIFDSEYIKAYSRVTVGGMLDSNEPIALLNNDETLLREYANTVYYTKGGLTNYVLMLEGMQKRIPGMIQFFQKEYHLE